MTISLRSYFAFIFSAFIIIFTAVISIVISKESGQNSEEQISASLNEKANQLADQLDYFMWSRYGEITVLSHLDTIQNPQDIEEVSDLVNELKANIPSYSWLGYTDTRGMVRASTDNILLGADISERPVFKNATDKTFIGDVHDAVLLAKLLPNPSGEPLQFVDISSPIYNEEGNFQGVLAAHFSWEWANEVKKSIIKPIQQKEEQLDVFIVSKKDNTVILGPKDMVGKPLHMESVMKAQQGKSHWKLEKWPDGKHYLTGYALADGFLNYPGLEWSVLIRQPEDIAFKSVKDLRNKVILIGFLFAFLFAIIGWFLARMISNPLKQLALTAEKLRNGERVEVPIKEGITDIKILSTSLSELISTLTQTESDLDKMESLAQLDKLTGLPNRLSLEEYLKKKKAEFDENQNPYAILYIDLDGFKSVNDTFGHHHGDVLLQAVANRLKRCIRSHEFVFRLGGDEFVILLETFSEPTQENIKLVANRIIAALNEPFHIEGSMVNIGCSIGCALWPTDDIELYQVVRYADQALYVSKENGKNQLTFYKNTL
ncbi:MULTISPECIES: diguanylate cyclase [unclassified Bacillus (in: firmicutes)]|uniref:sensor domain-containing diguanylate cyclase n=1 Tax=unclassified Bacillus (in: firmicutes) TaxID=185979 RepID=UPI0008E6285A|nr:MULTISPECIES: diguanylate cyclase [unclassified Bacillus (in: firmicutes)]SFA86015.1 diguanylate cyclase (GGDEF) domain-containing protein [Bacillus sp. UNCCL13]SFQ83565.1 diguanylate cyclase (GGDEF) domain-containing protein [Bacillus sp. cl95]